MVKETAMIIAPDLELFKERLARYIDRSEPDQCWTWAGAKDSHGYARIRIGGKTYFAHQLAYRIANGSEPDNLQIVRSCGNAACCNPSHLRAGR
jgi:hypothetical protein